MTFKELFNKTKIEVSKAADWNVLNTVVISTIVIGFIIIGYWLYMKNERYNNLIYHYNQQYFSIAKNIFYEECISNSAFISRQLLKNKNSSNLYEICSYDSVQSASIFSSFRPEEVSFLQYLLGTFPILYSSEQMEVMARKSAIEYEKNRVQFAEQIEPN